MIISSPTVIALGLFVASCATASALHPSAFHPRSGQCGQRLNFTTCSPDYGLPFPYECGKLSVPLDHDNPANGTLQLWVSRRKATGNGTFLGTFLFNPGGPGTSASSIFQSMAKQGPGFSRELLDSYDIIALDPRGTGYSHQIKCDPKLFAHRPSLLATSEQSFDALVAYNKAVGQSCMALSGPVFHFVDSISIAKDMDLLRRALGLTKLNYIGSSYGSAFGQTFAELFPERVGRFVFDGVVDRSEDHSSFVLSESQSFETAAHKFFDWCNTTTTCALYGEDLPRLFDRVTRASSSVPTTAGNLTGEDILRGIHTLLTFGPKDLPGIDPNLTWEGAASILNQTIHGNDATPLLKILEPKNTTFTDRAAVCQDFNTLVKSPGDLATIIAAAEGMAPHTRGITHALETQAYCVGWPAAVRHIPHKMDPSKAAKLPPILLVTAFYDPFSGPRWAAAVRDQIPRAVNVFRNGVGHTSYWTFGKTRETIDRFMLTGDLPVDATVYDS
ncbi:alpha/beta-hydrolase [Thozetella sp. PMI_491]|nr:alpha/beta-hydrolase [Thozetella sp. PMI_491]